MSSNAMIYNEDGTLMDPNMVASLGLVLTSLRLMTDYERGLVLCWFCKECNKYIGPGDACHCSNEE